MKICFIVVIVGAIAITYYSFQHTVNFYKGDKVVMPFKGSPAVLAACGFGTEDKKPLISKLSDHDRIDLSPCGTVQMYASNGGLDFQQVEDKCTSVVSFVSVKNSPCNTNDTPSNKGCANALAFHCSSNKKGNNCFTIQGHGYSGKCNVKKGICEKGTPKGKKPPSKNTSLATCVPNKLGKTHKGKCYLFAQDKSSTKQDRWKACVQQFGCCKGGKECGSGQKCCKTNDGTCKNPNGRSPQGKGVCCGGLKPFQVATFGLLAEGTVKKVDDKNHVSVQWEAIKVASGGDPQEDCRLLRSEDNKEIHPVVFGSPEQDPKGISWLVPTGSSQSKNAKSWQLKSHKVHTKHIGHIDNFNISHKKYPQDKSKYKNTDKCPPQMPYLTPNKGNKAQCCARQPVKKKMKVEGNIQHVYVCPDPTQCQQGDPISSSVPLCCQLPISQHKCPHKHNKENFKCPGNC